MPTPLRPRPSAHEQVPMTLVLAGIAACLGLILLVGLILEYLF
jgi:uncharacterized OsmC-like protein